MEKGHGRLRAEIPKRFPFKSYFCYVKKMTCCLPNPTTISQCNPDWRHHCHRVHQFRGPRGDDNLTNSFRWRPSINHRSEESDEMTSVIMCAVVSKTQWQIQQLLVGNSLRLLTISQKCISGLKCVKTGRYIPLCRLDGIIVLQCRAEIMNNVHNNSHH